MFVMALVTQYCTGYSPKMEQIIQNLQYVCQLKDNYFWIETNHQRVEKMRWKGEMSFFNFEMTFSFF